MVKQKIEYRKKMVPQYLNLQLFFIFFGNKFAKIIKILHHQKI